MLSPALRSEILAGLRNGSVVPYLGPGVLADVFSPTGARMPATSDELILGLNGGRPMAPKLMYEFSRAAMSVELKRGRSAVTRFLDTTYGAADWSRAAVHDWIKALRPPYVIDINRDTQLIDSYAGTPHLLVLGCARSGGTDFRFKLFAHDGAAYTAIAPEQANPDWPVLFKPMGAPRPQSSYIAADADYVDYITELMGGYAIPAFVKIRRRDKRYLLLGMRLSRDTERMVLSDMIYAAARPAGWALMENASDKERRCLDKLNIELVDASIDALIADTMEAASC